MIDILLFVDYVYLFDGWCCNVLLCWDVSGMLIDVMFDIDVLVGVVCVVGLVLFGMLNLYLYVF